MKPSLSTKSQIKMISLVLFSLIGGLNCISLYKIGKKLNSKVLMILSATSILLFITGVTITGLCNGNQAVLNIVIPTSGLAIFLPTVLSLANIGRYKNVCIIEELTSAWGIDVKALCNNGAIHNSNSIEWATPSLLKAANQVYPQKGETLINEIDSKMKQAQIEAKAHAEEACRQKEQERLKAEDARRIAEEARLEELRLQEQIEREKRLAEEKRLEGIRTQEQIEREKREFDEKFKDVQKEHAVAIASVKADANRKLVEAKKISLEKDRLLQEEKRVAAEREASLQAEINRLRNEKAALEGENTVQTAPQAITYCKSCGKALMQGKSFCVYCGAKN